MPRVVDHSLRRREISATAAGLIAREGIDAATIRKIAKTSGYSKGVIEHYFDDKDELISGALEWINECYEQRVAKVTAGLSGLGALAARIEAILPVDATIRDEWKVRMVFWSLATCHRKLRLRQARRFHNAVELYAGDIRAAIAGAEIVVSADATEIAYRLFTSTIGISTVALYNPSRYDKAYLLAQIAPLIGSVSEEV